jgi:hypothetical protein
MKIEYYGLPENSLESLLEKYHPNMYLILEDVLESKRTFRFVYQQLLDILKWGFEIKEIRTRPIHFKFFKEDEKIHTLQIRHFISNMILWQSFIEMDQVDILNEKFIFDFSKYNINSLVDYIDNLILPYHEGDFASKNKTVDEICYNVTAISNAFCLLMGMGISIYDIIQVEKQCPEITEIIFGEIDNSLQPNEIEMELMRRTNRLMELFTQYESDLKPLFLSGNNISSAQFKEIAVKIGFKSNINGQTIPVLIDANLLTTGINKPSYLYIDALSGRKALLMSKLSIS